MTNTHVITVTSHSPTVVHSSPTTSLIDSFPSSLTDIHRSTPSTTQVTTTQALQQENGSIHRQQVQPYLQRSQRLPRQHLPAHHGHQSPSTSRMGTTSSIVLRHSNIRDMTNTNSPHHDYSVAEWVGGTVKGKSPSLPLTKDWKDVDKSVKQMDQLYDATFYSWLKSEDNVLVTAMYLHRIANEYSLDRVINAVKWLVADWHWESTSILVRHITVGWCDEEGDMRRAQLLRHLTQSWATQYTATLITAILTAPPYATAPNTQRERFTRAFTDGWGFSKLSEFFMYLQSQANINYKVKCLMLQEAAGRERKKLSAKLDRRRRRHHHEEDHSSTNTSTTPALSPVTCSTTDPKSQSTDELSSYSSVQMDYHHSGASITRRQHPHRLHHVSGLDFDECTSEGSSCVSQANTSSLPSRFAETSHPNQHQQQQQAHGRYHHHQHHRRISSSDMMDVKRQRFSSAFDDDSTDIDYQQDDQQQQHSNVSFILSPSSNSGTTTTTTTNNNNKNSTTSTMTTVVAATTTTPSTSTKRSSIPATTASSSTQSQSTTNMLAENGHLTNDLPEMGLGSAARGGCSAGSGTTHHPTTSSTPSTHNHHHQRRQSSTFNTSVTISHGSHHHHHQVSGASVNDSGGGIVTPLSATSNSDNGIIDSGTGNNSDIGGLMENQ